MGLIQRVANRFGYVKRPRPGRRGYDAAVVNRLTSSWLTTNRTADEELKATLKAIRARSRNLAQNNDHAKRFLKMITANVVGVNGIALQSKVKQPDGSFDTMANRIIEEAWGEWGRKGTASVCGTLSWKDIQCVAAESVGRDGEILIRKDTTFDNGFRFALQLIEADHLDEDYNRERDSRRNAIRMGVEVDRYDRPVAYHLLQTHPGENTYNYAGREYERIPADQIIHLFIKERPTQSRGVPWMHTAMTRLNMLGGYEEAELVAARVAASKMGFFYNEEGNASYSGDTDESGDVVTEAEPGTFDKLPPGLKFQSWDPQHPNSGFKDFEKAILRGISSGLNVSYNSLASDLEGVNYSSIRQGVLDERDHWRMLQSWMRDHLHASVFGTWLFQGLSLGAINLPPAKFKKFNAPRWQPRGWGWVDPLKDTKSNIESVGAGLKTRSSVVAEQGLDLEDVFEQLAAEKKLADHYGLTLNGNAKNLDKLEDEDEDTKDGQAV